MTIAQQLVRSVKYYDSQNNLASSHRGLRSTAHDIPDQPPSLPAPCELTVLLTGQAAPLPRSQGLNANGKCSSQ